MAQRAKTASTAKTPTGGARRGQPLGSKSAKPAVAKPAATRRMPAAASPAPKLSKDELRVHVEKLERTVATLRTRSREAARAAKQAAARIEELETQLAAKEQVAKPVATTRQSPERAPKPAPKSGKQAAPKIAKSRRGKAANGERDPGDAVPPGVAVAEPEPMDAEAATAFENLQARLHPGDEQAGS